jgi:hypothetical protein
MSDQPIRTEPGKAKLPPPTRAQRLAAFGFLGAFALTIITVLLTGLSVGAPSARHVLNPAPPAADTHSTSPQADSPSASSSAAQAAPGAPPPSVGDPRTDEGAAAREDAARDPDGAKRKDAKKHTDDSRASDAR